MFLEGTPNADIICGFRGNDTIRGYGGADCIDGGAGRDKLYGGAGNDKLYGGGGGDVLRGEGGSDYLDGGLGTDTLNGGNNTDTCINGETIKYCENLNSQRNDFSFEEYYADSDSKRIRTSKPKDLAKESLKKNPDNLASINLKRTLRHSKLRSYVESFKLFLISLLFSANAYAQTITPTAFIHLEYSYDGVGNVTGIIDHTDSQNTRSMQYDGLDRLTGASGVWGPGSFSYDPIGNRTKKSIGSSNSNYSYGASDNRLSGYSHDASGNLLQDDSFIYEYDSENRLVAVRSGANVIAEYQYDGEGRRIKKVANGETTYYAYGAGPNVLTELNGQGVPKYDYIYAGSRNVARVNFDENGAVQNKSFYHTDHLGSSLAITDETTTVIWNQNYLPFGEPHGGSGTIINSRQYTGKEFEEETGLYYYGARYYHSGLGRFMSVDPAPADPTDPQSWNRYAYVLNNPYKYVDPDGKCPDDPLGLGPSRLCTDFGGPLGVGGGSGKGLNLGRLLRFALPSGPKRLALPKPTTSQTIETPYGIAKQANTPEALSLRQQVENGAQIFRAGNFPKSMAGEAQFFSPNNPLTTPDFANRVGAANLGKGTPDFVIGGRLKPGTPFITRPAPRVGNNEGGDLEIVTPPGSIQIDFFYMP